MIKIEVFLESLFIIWISFYLLSKKKLILNQKFSVTEKVQKCFVEINRLFVVLRKTYKGKKICFKRISSFPGGEIVKSSRHLLNTNFLFNLCYLVMISRWMRKDFLLLECEFWISTNNLGLRRVKKIILTKIWAWIYSLWNQSQDRSKLYQNAYLNFNCKFQFCLFSRKTRSSILIEEIWKWNWSIIQFRGFCFSWVRRQTIILNWMA